jgi:hypothetical protein
VKAIVALLLASLAFSPASFAQEKKAEKKKPVAKKVQKKADQKAGKKAAAASSSGDWSRFNSSAERDLKADEDRRKAKAGKK